MKETADYCASEEKNVPPHIYLMGGKLPAGVIMKEAEQALAPMKGTLEQLFQQWSLTKAMVILTVEQGKVKKVQVKSYQGKGYKKEALEEVLQNIAFASSVTGTIELELVYM